MTDDPYDDLAEAYAAHNETAPYNALYERPAMLGLLGDVSGRDVLDLGCGPGVLTAALAERGARVTGLDRSAAMVALARERVGDRAEVRRHGTTATLPLPDEAVDVVVAGLLLHYLDDWAPTLAAIRRVLRPGGRLVASVHHPFRDAELETLEPQDLGDYLESYPISERWDLGGRAATVRYWHHPLGRMTGWIAGAGLALTDVVEPRPLDAMAASHPSTHALLRAAPAFLLLGAARM